ncbi:MAG: beta strand repeat-containing protein [Minisyncoccota bacterium]
MKSLLASFLTSRTTRVAALFLSVSAIAMGGFFISTAQAYVPNLVVTHPDGTQYWRGDQTISWAASTTALTMKIGYTTTPGSWQNTIASPVTIADGSTGWNTAVTGDGTYYIKLAAIENADEGLSNAFNIDNTKPVTTLATSTLPDTTGWYNTAHPVSDIVLTCTDGGSGCSTIHYQWGSGAVTDVSVNGSPAAATILAANVPQGDNVLTYWSEDKAVDNANAHNIEATHSAEFKVDTVAPTILSYTLNGLAANAYFNPVLASTTSIALTASEPVTWTTIEVKNGSEYTISHPGNVGLIGSTTWNGVLSGGGTLSDGAYDLYYNIKDLAGNTTTLTGPLTPNQIIVDTSAPSISGFTSPVADAVYKSNAILTFTPTDTGGAGSTPITCGYSLNGTATTTLASCTSGAAVSSASLSGLQEGRNTIVLQVMDAAGNAVYSAPVSFVYDNNNTLTVGTVPAQDFATINEAVSKAVSGNIIDIFPGTYTENVNVNKSLTLQSHSGASGTTIHGLVTVTADNTTVKNLSFTNPSASTALSIIGANTVSVTGNTFDTVGTTLSSGSAQAIDVNGGSNPAMSGITISGNTISNVGSVNLAYDSSVSGTSAKGIYIGDSTGNNTISGVTIDNNIISNITASHAAWKVGRGAYGVLVNHEIVENGITGTTGVTITNNTISGLDGLWATAIGLEGNTPGALVAHNVISGLTSVGNAANTGVHLEDNANASSVTIQYNNFANTLTAGVVNSTSATTTAINNWWGSIEGPKPTSLNPHGAGAGVSANVTFVPWCTDATCSTLDSSAPTATLTGTPAAITNVTTTNITVGPSGDVVYYKYQLDGGVWSAETPVATAIATSSLADGSHTLNVLGRDQAGNWQTVNTMYSWTVDTTPPALAEVTPVTTPTATTTPTYVFSTTKLGGITYGGGCTSALAPSATTTGDVAITFDHLSDGLYNACTITVTDSAGNVSNVLPVTQFLIDTTAPSVNAGTDKYVNVATTTTAVVTDAGSGVATYTWTQETGGTGAGTVTFGTSSAENTTISASSDGTYILRLTVTDNAGNSASDDMTLTWDMTKPVITPPSNITMEATANMTPLMLTPATATDNIDLHPIITSNAPATFPVGTTTVTWTATDAAGNAAHATQQVVITDHTAPTIASHGDETVEATSASGAHVTYTLPVATDVVDGTDTVTCLPASGTTFALGNTTVTCNATDTAGNAAAPVTFTVTVHDTTAPVIAVPSNMTETADQLGGKHVTYAAPIASDAVDGNQSAVCTPASGSLFAVNQTTTVTCTKTDAHGNVATPTTFTVTVNPDVLAQIGISASPSSLTTADTSTITVAGQDQYGNTVTTDNSTIAVLSTDGSGSLADTLLHLVSGVQTTTLTSSQAGVVHVNAASGVLTPNVVAVTFTGAAVPDTTAPVITNVQSTNIGTSTVQVTWTTNELATSQVEYGTTSGYGTSNTVDSTLTASHSMTLTGLVPNTTYHFRVKSSDAATNLATSGDNTFTTVVDDNTAALAVTGIDSIQSDATPDNTFSHGFKWVFHVTVPTTETQFAMKFSDFIGVSGGTIPAANNIRFYSSQSSDASASTTAMLITSNGYSSPITLSSDLHPSTAGRQIDVTVEMKVPTGTTGGSYSASYGIQSN